MVPKYVLCLDAIVLLITTRLSFSSLMRPLRLSTFLRVPSSLAELMTMSEATYSRYPGTPQPRCFRRSPLTYILRAHAHAQPYITYLLVRSPVRYLDLDFKSRVLQRKSSLLLEAGIKLHFSSTERILAVRLELSAPLGYLPVSSPVVLLHFDVSIQQTRDEASCVSFPPEAYGIASSTSQAVLFFLACL
ncbi:hypothetical protein F4820DRAFT_166000 [Hypoxylon rubiginosum]|uniref:Uncharacterized protein n=1 Tax=Hypoxylon rubiginosum TaxID=110542 RepID=A0ACB9YJ96_9PEZI|nr:hypothetical protein F4820DRAFT_166000 [Hypoxylon rubiginosum]